MKYNSNLHFKETLTYLRNSKGLTRTQLAKELNVLRSTYGNWETYGVVPNENTLKIISDYFGITIEKLLFEEE